jgi:hypothetical protein
LALSEPAERGAVLPVRLDGEQATSAAALPRRASAARAAPSALFLAAPSALFLAAPSVLFLAAPSALFVAARFRDALVALAGLDSSSCIRFCAGAE